MGSGRQSPDEREAQTASLNKTGKTLRLKRLINQARRLGSLRGEVIAMRFKNDENRRHLAQALYILSGIALVCGLGMAFYFFQFNFETQGFSLGFVARTEWQILLVFGLLLAGVIGLIVAWRVSEGSDDE